MTCDSYTLVDYIFFQSKHYTPESILQTIDYENLDSLKCKGLIKTSRMRGTRVTIFHWWLTSNLSDVLYFVFRNFKKKFKYIHNQKSVNVSFLNNEVRSSFRGEQKGLVFTGALHYYCLI
jgi:hypothetical protein